MKKLFVCLAVIAIFSQNGITAFAAEDYYAEQYEISEAEKLKEYLNDEARDFLDTAGCDEISPDKILGLTPQSAANAIFGLFKSNYKKPLKGALTATGAVMLLNVCSAFFPDDEKSRSLMNMIGGCFLITTVLFSSLTDLNTAASAMSLCAGFEKLLIPILAGLLTASGNPTSAMSYQGVAFAAAQCVQSLAESFAVPLSCMAGVLGAVGAVLPTVRLSAVGDFIRKTVTTVTGSAAAMFSGLLAMKGILASSSDNLASKGIKLAANTFVPVVGGALSEAYSSLSGSLALLKNTVGIYAVAAVVAMCLPSVISLTLWSFSLKAAAMISDLLGNSQSSEILKNISYIYSTLNAMLIFSAAVFIISSALAASIKTGV